MTDAAVASDLGGLILVIGGILLTIGIRWFLMNQRDKKFLYPIMGFGIGEIALGAVIVLLA